MRTIVVKQFGALTQFGKARGINAARLLGLTALFVLLAGTGAYAQDDMDATPLGAPSLYDSSDSAAPSDADQAALPNAPTVSSLSHAGGNVEVRMSQLESQLRTLTGKIEELQHQIQAMQPAEPHDEELGKLDERLSALEQKQNAAALGAPTAAAPTAAAMPPQPAVNLSAPDLAPPPTDQFSGGTANATHAPPKSVITHATKLQSADAAPAIDAPAEAPGAALGTLAQSSDGDTKPHTPDKTYEQAYAQMTAHHYDTAQRGFESFLAQYPKHPLAANAQYWLGQSYFAQNQYDSATKAFALTYQKYPQSPKAPDALLKLGLSLSSLGKHDEACLTYAQLKKQYPASGATVTRAAAEAKKLACKP